MLTLFPSDVIYMVQKLKTRVVKNNCNPEWNDELTLSITDVNVPITLVSDTLPFLSLFCGLVLILKEFRNYLFHVYRIPIFLLVDSSLSLGNVRILFAFIFLKYLAGKMIVKKSYRKLIQQVVGSFIYLFFLFADSLRQRHINCR